MVSFVVRHPDEWIGVPERWPFETPRGTAYDPEVWILDIARLLLASDEDDADDAMAHVRQVLTLAVQRGVRTGLRTYVGFEDYQGAAYIVESGAMPYTSEPGQTILEYLEIDDPEQVGPSSAEEFTTTSGIAGARCYRYFRADLSSTTVYGRLDYIFVVDATMLFIRGAEHNLVSFERLKRYVEPLALSVGWIE